MNVAGWEGEKGGLERVHGEIREEGRGQIIVGRSRSKKECSVKMWILF